METVNLHVQCLTDHEDKRRYADQAYLDHLYVSGWRLEDELYDIASGKIADKVIISTASIMSENLPETLVGIAVCYQQDINPDIDWEFNARDVVCFVRPDFRRKGIGSQLIKAFNRSDLVGYSGEKGAHHFWASNNVIFGGMK